MYFSENIKLLRKRKRLSQEDVAQALDVKRSSLSGYEIGTAYPNYPTLIQFSEFFNVSLDKLLKIDLGDISELQLSELEKGYDIDLSGNKLRVLATTVDTENEENIEIVPMKAKAGYTNGFADPDYIKVLPTFQLPFLDRNKKYRTFQVDGDSMPPVSHGAWVTGEYLQNWNFIKDGYPYIVVTKDEGVVFKILYNQIEGKKELQLCSTNPAYEPYQVPISEVLEIWKFVNYINSELPEPNLNRDDLHAAVMTLQRELKEVKNELRSG